MRSTKIKEYYNPDFLSSSFGSRALFTMIGLPIKVHHRSRLVTLPTITVTLGFLLAMLFVVQLIREKEAFGQELGVENSHSPVFSKDSRNSSGSSTTIAFTRKLLQSPGDDGNRIGTTCSKNDIVIFQGSAAPLPNGIPSYSVQILNVCVSGCSISNIHVSCGWFSTVRLINPRVFRRVYYDDCLVNDGQALGPGESLSFEYANSYSYPLSVSSVFCC